MPNKRDKRQGNIALRKKNCVVYRCLIVIAGETDSTRDRAPIHNYRSSVIFIVTDEGLFFFFFFFDNNTSQSRVRVVESVGCFNRTQRDVY